MEKLLIIATPGFIILAIYRIYFKTQFNEQNTYETLFTSLVFGLIPYVFYHLFLIIPFPTGEILNKYPLLGSEELHEVYRIINATISTIISAFLVCFCQVGNILIKFREGLSRIGNDKMDLNMTTEKEFHEFQHNYSKVFFQLKNGKVIIGFVKFADYSDTVPPELRIVQVQVLKSGTRSTTNDKDINFNVNYDDLATEKLFEEKMEEIGINWEEKYKDDKSKKELEKLQQDAINKFAPTYSIFQREIKYYSKFDEEIHRIFQENTIAEEPTTSKITTTTVVETNT